jgi:hypothetical protein
VREVDRQRPKHTFSSSHLYYATDPLFSTARSAAIVARAGRWARDTVWQSTDGHRGWRFEHWRAGNAVLSNGGLQAGPGFGAGFSGAPLRSRVGPTIRRGTNGTLLPRGKVLENSADPEAGALCESHPRVSQLAQGILASGSL